MEAIMSFYTELSSLSLPSKLSSVSALKTLEIFPFQFFIQSIPSGVAKLYWKIYDSL